MKRARIICLTIIALFFITYINTTAVAMPSNWAQPEIRTAMRHKLVPDQLLGSYQAAINRQEFCALVIQMYETVTGITVSPVSPNPFRDTRDIQVLKASTLGIVQGVDSAASIFAPEASITRQEIAVMIYRTLELIDQGINADNIKPRQFQDENQIALWAIDEIHYLRSKNIMQGTENNYFQPLENTSREQAIALIKRVYENTIKPAAADQYELRGIKIGMGEQSVSAELGKPDRVAQSRYGFKWHIYNRDYSKYLQVGIQNGTVVALYTPADFWKSSYGIGIGSSRDVVNDLYKITRDEGGFSTDIILNDVLLRLYYDTLNGNTVDSIMLINREAARQSAPKTIELQESCEKEIFDITNAYRVRNHKAPCSPDNVLAQTARRHSQDMISRNYFAHENPSGEGPGDRLNKAGIVWRGWGENIAAGRPDPIDTVESWINSRGHRDIILGDFKQSGVGVAYGGYYGSYYTQMFCSR